MNYIPEDQDYEEPTSLASTIEKMVEEEVNNRVFEIQQRADQMTKKYYEMYHENIELKKTIEHSVKNEVSMDFVTHNIISKITKDNIEQFLEFSFKKTFNEDGGMDCPTWLKLFVNYYNDREVVFNLLDIAKIEYPAYAKAIQLPHEWNEQDLDLFFDTMKNHYVTNGCMYDRNLGFWYREWNTFKFDVEKCLRRSHSQTPWQFVLKNPLLNSEKYAHKIANAINGGFNGGYFIKVFEYKNLDNEIKQIIFKETKKLPEMSVYDFHKLIEGNLESVNSEWMDKYFAYSLRENSSYNIEKVNKLPKEYLYRYLRECKDLFEALPKINLTREEKIEFVKGL
jgi:hypothetical protein